jgi:penicillin G amidase
MKLLKHFWPSIFLVLLCYGLNRPWGPVPALGSFLSPFEGFMQNAESKIFSKGNGTLEIPGLSQEVSVIYDANKVPHIFAENESDLYTAQGYIMAQDRLWQMEFYTLASAGRISEVVGPKALEYDKYHRRLGMAKTASQMNKNLKPGSLEAKVFEAFSKGVNHYISTLSSKNLPLEYKILGHKPEPWTTEKTLLMFMNMRNVLNGGSDDYYMSNVASAYGPEIIADLFTDYPKSESPIIPAGTSFGFKSVNTSSKTPSPVLSTELNLSIKSRDAGIGSNNWAVAGSRSATGLPILANDPHLNLTLPSIWYQMQLSCPGLNVYGVSLPGVPGIIIGFNKDVSWGVTNVGSDVMDFYKIEFQDASRKAYKYEGAWKTVETRVEKYVVKGLPEPVLDTVLYTHHGPIIYAKNGKDHFSKQVPIAHAMHWIAHEPSTTDLNTFYLLNRAKTYDDYRNALSNFVAPAQNFVFANNAGDIGITPNGKFPIKRKNQGKFILDGSLAANDWQGWIPFEQNPTVKNPSRGFVSSANQHSTDPTYPYYLGWKFAPPFRGIRINEQLAKFKKATADSLRVLQNDNFNVMARRILPSLLPLLQADPKNTAALNALKSWNFQNNADEIGAAIFETWLPLLKKEIWDDEFPESKNMIYPSTERTFDLIETKPSPTWFDNISTPNKKETLAEVVNSSFRKTIAELTQEQGPFNPEKWKWSNVKGSEVNHLVSAFTSFSRKDIKTGGGSNVVNAHTKLTGPSWRMVVELDKNWPRAYGLYPGGQSGSPGSKYYDNMLDSWAAGKLDTLKFMKSKTDNIIKNQTNLILKPKL